MFFDQQQLCIKYQLLRGPVLIGVAGSNLVSLQVEWIERVLDLAVRLKESTTILTGVLCAYLSFKGCEHQSISSLWGFVLLPIVLLFAWLAHKGVTSMFLVLLTTSSLLLLALLF